LNGGIGTSNSLFATSASSNSQQTAAIPFTKITSGTESKVRMRVNYLITSADELRQLWGMVSATGTPPAVDFKKNAVIAVFAGEQPTVGHVIEVSKIEDSTVRNVSLTIMKPDTNCMVAQTVTAPYEIVAMPATALPLTHQDTLTVNKCPRD